MTRIILFILSGMLLLASGAKAEDNLKGVKYSFCRCGITGVKLLCSYELYSRAVEPGNSAWTIYSPKGLEFIDSKNLIIYTIAPGIDNFKLRSENREYLALTSLIEIKKKNSKDKDFYIDRTTLDSFYTYSGTKSSCLPMSKTENLSSILEEMWKNVSTSIKLKRKI